MDNENICIECGKVLIGRADRKFCCPECRISYHNREYRRKNREINRINKILRKNYIILENTLAKGLPACTSRYLYEAGFNFDYFTSLDGIGSGKPAKMVCYNISYYLDNKGMMTIEYVNNC